jgi:3-hydroxyacyl-CoA dehydrogenase
MVANLNIKNRKRKKEKKRKGEMITIMLDYLLWLLLQKQGAMVKDVMSRISTNTKAVDAAKNTDLVIEAIVENLDVKRKLFKDLDNAAPK